MNIPTHQYAVQLVGPDEPRLLKKKAVRLPGAHQILARVEAVGLCFSDLKLLQQFSGHARKGEIIEGMDLSLLRDIPSYRPGQAATVPGHEAVCTIAATGPGVTQYSVGQRVLVQTDYRWLKTRASNAAFGYNFEGALQEYVLLDERVIVDPDTGEGFLVPVPDTLSHAAVALMEPWACVESSYVTRQRHAILPGGRLLVVADTGHDVAGIEPAFDARGKPGHLTLCCQEAAQARAVQTLGVPVTQVRDMTALQDTAFDDIIYFGSHKAHLDLLNDKLAHSGLCNIVLGGHAIGTPVTVGVGRVHYSMTRWIGTTGSEAAESYQHIPATGEIRDRDKAVVIGAGGPMGQMHVIRLVCAGRRGLSITATDLDESRLVSLGDKVNTLAHHLGVGLRLLHPREQPPDETFSYAVIMAPLGDLAAQAIIASQDRTLINIFAGIPAHVKHDLDLDTYITHHCFMFGSSGSRLSDMKIVLDKTLSGQLNTNLSVDAVSGMAGAIEGLAAIENRALPGKIIVYPALKDIPLIRLADLKQRYPTVAAKLDGLTWTKQAEEELLRLNSLLS